MFHLLFVVNPSPAWQVQFTRSDEIGSFYHNALYRLRDKVSRMKIEILELNSNECISYIFSSKPTLVLYSTAHLHPIKSSTQEDIWMKYTNLQSLSSTSMSLCLKCIVLHCSIILFISIPVFLFLCPSCPVICYLPQTIFSPIDQHILYPQSHMNCNIQ